MRFCVFDHEKARAKSIIFFDESSLEIYELEIHGTHLNRLPKENRETFELSKEKKQTFRDKLETAERERSMRIREV